MDLQTILTLINQMQNNNNSGANGIMNFFAQNQNTNNSQNRQNFGQSTGANFKQGNENSVNSNSSRQNGLDLSQILGLLSSSGNNNLASLFPLLNAINLPNGFSSINQINGMQNFSSILNNLGTSQKQPTAQAQKQTESNIIRSKNYVGPIDKFKRP